MSTWEEVTGGVIRRRLPGWDETVGAVAGDGGLLLVDTGPSPAVAEEVGREAGALLGAPVTWLVVTHPHFDHLLGAGAFPGAAAYGPRHDGREAAQDAVHQGLPPAEAEQGAALLPGVRWHVLDGTDVELDLGGGRRVLLVDLGAAHSSHDVAVVVPGPVPVVFCGDLVEESGEPQAGPDARPARWPTALDRLLELGGPDAVYVPGHGALVDAAFVRAQRDALHARFGASAD
ncbi:MBL fold metallo-hydrolase [Streptomyces avicenniae]|uniref:MBL fold metallo-hydrolase n=1 Tax=Streptomyces avicenniae TaxID=500153 RepID=UPI00069ABD5B|nr:MBL fold metallo-hydrolase [Streptomyces avicenniae]